MKFYITKDWHKHGIRHVELGYGALVLARSDRLQFIGLGHRHTTLEAAQTKLVKERARKVALLEKEIQRLKAISLEPVNEI
jgi:hypothetical protein